MKAMEFDRMNTKNADGFSARLEAMLAQAPRRNAADKAGARTQRGLGNSFDELAEAWPYLLESERHQVLAMVRALRQR